MLKPFRALVFASFLVAGMAGTVAAGNGGAFGSSEGSSVDTACVVRGGWHVTVIFYIQDAEDHKACLELGGQSSGVWNLDFFLRRFHKLFDD